MQKQVAAEQKSAANSINICCKHCQKVMKKENIKRHMMRVHDQIIQERKKRAPNAIFKPKNGEDYEDVCIDKATTTRRLDGGRLNLSINKLNSKEQSPEAKSELIKPVKSDPKVSLNS